MLVASAIFAIVAAVAFILYSAAQKSYKAGENFTDQQQATRVAFDRMISDIRLAGFNYNPDGDKSRVDEQVEGAWDTAVTIRGDFDFEDPTASVTPESSLAGSSYNVVSTGNDEIVTYVLSKPGLASTGTMDLWLDADKPRVKSVKQITIPKVALIQDSPPYTLYRVTLADVTGTFPVSPQAATNFVYEPVADNLKSMTFQYYDDSGNLLNPNTPADPSDDIAGDDTKIDIRAKVRRISVNLVGMTRDPDINYSDATDANAATQNYRKFDLSSDVNPENLGKSGIKDVDITPPPTPTNIVLVPGHCLGILVKWDTPPSSAGVASNVIKYWPFGSPGSAVTRTFPYPHSEYGTVDTLAHAFVDNLTGATKWCFQAQAKDALGNISGWSDSPSTAPCMTLANTSTPAPAANLKATGDGTLSPQDSQITLTWDLVKTNAPPQGVVSGDPNTIGGYTILRDGKGFKIYRDTSSSSTSAMLVADSTATPPATPNLSTGATQYVNTPVDNCVDYYYQLETYDTCGLPSATRSASARGSAYSTIAPKAPTAVTSTRSNGNTINVSWAAVTQNVANNPTTINKYNIYRTTAPAGTPWGSLTWSGTPRGTSTTNSWVDNLDPGDPAILNGGSSFYYAVTAVSGCLIESAKSDPREVSCAWNDTFTTVPKAPSEPNGGGTQLLQLSWSGSDKIVRVRVYIPYLSTTGKTGNAIDYQWGPNTSGLTSPVAYPPTGGLLWNSQADGAGIYAINWEIENDGGCIQTIQTTYTVGSNAPCKLGATNPTILPVTGTPSNLYRDIKWDVQNYSGDTLQINEIDVTFSSLLGTHRLQTILWPSTATAAPGLFNFASPGALSKAVHFYLPGQIKFLGTPTPAIVNMQLNFDSAIRNTATPPVIETITVDYFYTDTSNNSAKCSLQIISGP